MAERNENGQFVKGHPGGPGRPKKTKEEKFYKATISTVTLKDWREIVKKAADMAKRGDAPSRKWLSDYILGPPQQKMDVTSAGEKLRIFIDWDNLNGEGDSD